MGTNILVSSDTIKGVSDAPTTIYLEQGLTDTTSEIAQIKKS